MYLEEYLKRYSKAECCKLNTLIRTGDGTVKNTVSKLLEKHNADKKAIAKYQAKCYDEIDKQFSRLMDEVKDIETTSSTSFHKSEKRKFISPGKNIEDDSSDVNTSISTLTE